MLEEDAIKILKNVGYLFKSNYIFHPVDPERLEAVDECRAIDTLVGAVDDVDEDSDRVYYRWTSNPFLIEQLLKNKY